jgi:hypothetical protein
LLRGIFLDLAASAADQTRPLVKYNDVKLQVAGSS